MSSDTDTREAQRADVATGAIGDVSPIVVGPADGEGARAFPAAERLDVDQFLAGEPITGPVVVLDTPPARFLAAVARSLSKCAASGTPIVLAVGPGQEALVSPLLSGAHIVRQVAVEAVWIGVDPAPPIAVDVIDPAAATVRVLLIAGGVASAGSTPVIGRALSEQHHAAVEREAATLRAVNARLRGTYRPVESAAAGSLIAKVPGLELQLASLEEQLTQLALRLETEVGVGRQNDELFQDARRIIGLREEEIERHLGTLRRPRHRVAAGIGYRADRLPTPLRRVAGRLARRLMS